jgi:phosphoribosylamine---glycine ligase
MKILVIGSGGREHAIAWALQNSSTARVEVFSAPGNAGIAEIGRILPVAAADQAGLVEAARSERIDLTFVGPEAPLAAGLVDRFESEGLPIVGPGRLAARLESSKVFAKDFMHRYAIPTGRYGVANSSDEAIALVKSGEFGSSDSRVVIKADGLAAGKGVVVADSHSEAERAVADLMVRHLAGREAASRVIIEEALEGREVSLLVFADGNDYKLMPAARDHKRIGENDTGPNTGGMGCITDDSLLPSAMLDQIVSTVVEPTLTGAQAEGFGFRGILFFGLMITTDGPKLLEYNVRFGDPETQAILIRLRTDLSSIFEAIRTETLGALKVEWSEGSSACVVAANKGYPGNYLSGGVIEGLDRAAEDRVQIFHAGTSRREDGKIVASGGRVLGVSAAATSLPEALRRCYDALERINWPEMQFRRDIGRSVCS